MLRPQLIDGQESKQMIGVVRGRSDEPLAEHHPRLGHQPMSDNPIDDLFDELLTPDERAESDQILAKMLRDRADFTAERAAGHIEVTGETPPGERDMQIDERLHLKAADEIERLHSQLGLLRELFDDLGYVWETMPEFEGWTALIKITEENYHPDTDKCCCWDNVQSISDDHLTALGPQRKENLT